MAEEKSINPDSIPVTTGTRPVMTNVPEAYMAVDPADMPGTPGSSVSSTGMTGSTGIPGTTADNDDVIDTLNNLLETCRDGEYGFNASAEHVKSAEIKTMLMQHAGECRSGGQELQALIRQLGGESDDGGSMSGALHRGWVSVKGSLSGYSDKAMLEECERGEDSAVASYRKALKENLPSAIRSVVERQAQGVQRNHDQVKAMRDALRASS